MVVNEISNVKFGDFHHQSPLFFWHLDKENRGDICSLLLEFLKKRKDHASKHLLLFFLGHDWKNKNTKYKNRLF